jgi:hypothetical protein
MDEAGQSGAKFLHHAQMIFVRHDGLHSIPDATASAYLPNLQPPLAQ